MTKPPLDHVPTTFGGRLEMLMRERQLTNVQLRDAIRRQFGDGPGDSSISEYVHQKRLPTSENLLRLADFFGVSCDFLLCRTNVRCTLPDAGGVVARASDLELALQGKTVQGAEAYRVGADLRVVTPEEIEILRLPERKRARALAALRAKTS